jgi:hypothetical protein
VVVGAIVVVGEIVVDMVVVVGIIVVDVLRLKSAQSLAALLI